MKAFVVKCVVILIATGLTGCAGTKFVRIPDDSLILGQTTPEQIIARLGQPYREGTVTRNGQQIKTASYAYASVGGEPAAEGVTPALSTHSLSGLHASWEPPPFHL